MPCPAKRIWAARIQSSRWREPTRAGAVLAIRWRMHTVAYATATVLEFDRDVKCLGAIAMHDRLRRRYYIGIIAAAREPIHVRFLAEPGDLPLGKLPRGLLDARDNVWRGFGALLEARTQIGVANKLERL